MGKVYANGMEVCSGASGGQALAAMPDVCFTQPMAPPTPQGVPVPYPSNGMASDIRDGSTTVKVGGKPIALKDQSYFKKVTGDEAGNAGTRGLVSQTNTGKVYFASWSMNVKVEGKNVVRHMDMCTLNHGSAPGNTPPWSFLASQRPTTVDDAGKCTLRPYRPDRCPDGTTGHHCVPDHCFRAPGRGGERYDGAIDREHGLCVCVTGSTKSKTPAEVSIKAEDYETAEEHYLDLAEHGRIHLIFDAMEGWLGANGSPENTAALSDLETAAAESIAVVTGCDPADLKKQMRDYHNQFGLSEESRWRADPFGRLDEPEFEDLGTDTVVGQDG